MNQATKLERKIWLTWGEEFLSSRTLQYETQARKMFPRRGGPVSDLELRRKLKQARVIAVGDDRLNPLHQKEVLRLLSGLGRGRKMALLTDRFPLKVKSGINQYLRGKESLPKLLRRLGVDAPQVHSPEGGVSLWLKWMKQNQIKLHLLSSSEQTLGRRDRQLATEAKRLSSKYATTILWTGTLRVSPCHLPHQLRKRDVDFEAFLLGAPDPRWGTGLERGWIQTKDAIHAYVGDSPLLGMEYRRAWEHRVSALVSPEDLEAFFEASLERINQKLGKPSRRSSAILYHPFQWSHLERLWNRKKESKIGKFLYDRLLSHESAVIPESKEVLLSTLEKSHITEEAAHFLRLQGQKTQEFGPVRTSLEEAFGFLASRWIDPKREVPSADSAFMASWEAVHQAGYELGAHLHGVWGNSKKGRDKIRGAWNQSIQSEGDAYRLWTLLSEIQ